MVGTTSASYSSAGRGNINIGGSSGAICGFQIGGVAKGYIFHSGTDFQMWNETATPIIFGTNALERMRIDSSGNVGIGTSSPSTQLQVNKATAGDSFSWTNGGSTPKAGYLYSDANIAAIFNTAGAGAGRNGMQMASNYVSFDINASEAMRIDSSGNLLVGTTVNTATNTKLSVSYDGNSVNGCGFIDSTGTTAGTRYSMFFQRGTGTTVGSISTTTVATLFNTTSDYRLKTVIGVVSDAGKRLDAIQPIEYDWNAGGRTRGFLAHQFAEVYPNSVNGEKDAVDEKGKPVYQAMQASSSEVMADLIAEIQSLRKRIATLEAK